MISGNLAKSAKTSKAAAAQCKTNIEAVHEGLANLYTFQIHQGRMVKVAKKAQEVSGKLEKHLESEGRLYADLAKKMKDASSAWGKFWKVETKAAGTIASVLNKAVQLLTKEKKSDGAFVELPETLGRSLAEVSNVLFEVDSEAGGLKFFAQNLLEVAKEPKVLNNDVTREQLKSTMRKIISVAEDLQNSLIEENEHQVSILENTERLFQSAKGRVDAALKVVSDAVKSAGKKVEWTTEFEKAAIALSAEAQTVANDVRDNCHEEKDFHSETVSRLNRMNDVVDQVHAVINDRFPEVQALLEKFN